MATLNLLYKTEYRVNDYFTIRIPTVGEVVDNEDDYYGLLTLWTAMPIDMMVALDDAGIDFSTINEWDLFLILFDVIRSRDSSMLFVDLDFSGFDLAVNEQNNEVVLRDEATGAVIDRSIHDQIASVFRKINHIEKDRRKPANDDAKKFMLERARKKMQRNSRRKIQSQLEQYIVALVNTEQFSYRYDTARDLTIYQFNESVQQIVKKIEYDNRMIGVYAGTVSAKDLSQDDFNWLSHK